MKKLVFGQIHEFRYGRKKENRKIIFIEENKNYMVGIRLTGVPQQYLDEIMKVLNKKIFADLANNQELIEQALRIQKEKRERKFNVVLPKNPNDEEVMEMMQAYLFRVYDKKKMYRL
jgi:hypothetical protein